jgi:hypothetical protein
MTKKLVTHMGRTFHRHIDKKICFIIVEVIGHAKPDLTTIHAQYVCFKGYHTYFLTTIARRVCELS